MSQGTKESASVTIACHKKEMAMMASNSHAEGSSRGVPTENGLVAPALRFRQCKVSAIRDFSLGCSRVAAPITGPSEQAIID
ncbi:hypothetical protein J1N35_019034 [Gossypium stocksii]|uniref:Uncharacterized protein n=1 Tax=Gossypium stocksii TaxID=47602 RepID=A0A9D4A5I1_9ROSI|nr:hypothetical protein J1N35_019034 [Gossypium stocksii]